MKSIVYIYLMLIFFVYIISSSIVYMIISDYRENKINKKVEKLSETFGKEILSQLNKLKNNIEFSRRDVYKVKNRLNNKAYERVFNETIISFNQNSENYIHVKKYMESFKRYIKRLIKNNKKEGSIKNVYTAFLMGQYKVDNEYINEFLLDSLKTSSLYLRFNAMNSIGEIGNVEYFTKALLYISKTEGYLNEKLFIDIMNQFGGDMLELNKQLLKSFDEFSSQIQCIIIEHFQNVKYICAAQKFASKSNLIETDKEVVTSIVKYFNVINYPPVKPVLMSLLGDEQWEFRALAAKTLSKYYSQETVDKLLITITDINWFVRLNSAMSLLDFELGDNLLYDVLAKKDKYSTDIMFYAMFVKKKITYEEYLEKSNRQEVG